MFKLINTEFFKLRKRWMPYVLLMVMLVFILLPIALNYINYNDTVAQHPDIDPGEIYEQYQDSPGNTTITVVPGGPDPIDMEKTMVSTRLAGWMRSLVLPDAMSGIFNSLSGLGMFLVILFSASVAGTEYGWGTIRQVIARGTSRPAYLTSKLTTIALAIILGVVTVLVVGLVVTIITSMLITGSIEWAGFARYFFSSLVHTLLVVAVYLSMAAAFAVILRSAMAGMAVAAAWFIGETIIVALLSMSATWLAEISEYLISYNANQVLVLNNFSSAGDGEPWKAVGILLAYIAVFISATYYFLRRQDLTA